mgnify:CR=1 FL=1
MTTIPNLPPLPVVTGDDLLITHDSTTNRSGRVSAQGIKDYIVNAPDTALASSIKTVNTFSDLSTSVFPLDSIVYVRQHSLSSPGIGAGHYRTVSSSGLTANNGTVAINGSLAYVKIGREGDNFYKRKRIVVIGSSVPSGTGATSNYGYMQRLATALPEYEFINVSIGGNNTTSVMNRFFADVAHHQPNIVIIALSLGNEGLQSASDKATLCRNYINNFYTLAEWCRTIGAKAVFTGAYPRNDYSATDYKYLKQTNQILENSGLPYINLLGCIDDGAGHWRTGMWSDALHPNDIGHEAMFRSIPLSLFNSLVPNESLSPITVKQRFVIKLGTQTTAVPLAYLPENPFGSVTAMCTVRRSDTSTDGKAFLVFNSTSYPSTPLRIRNDTDYWSLCLGTTNYVTSTKLSSLKDETHLALKSDYYTNTHTLYVDGLPVGSFTADIGTVTSINFGGRNDDHGVNAVDYEFSNFAIWRTGLSDEQVWDAYNDIYSKSSLCVLSPPNESEGNSTTSLVNLAPSETNLKIYTDDIVFIPKEKGQDKLEAAYTQIANLQSVVTDSFQTGTWTPDLTTPGLTYTTQSGIWSIIGSLFYFEIYIAGSSVPASTTFRIAMPQPALHHPVFMDVRYEGTGLTSPDHTPYGYMNIDVNPGYLDLAQKLPGSGPEVLYPSPTFSLKVTGMYRFR